MDYPPTTRNNPGAVTRRSSSSSNHSSSSSNRKRTADDATLYHDDSNDHGRGLKDDHNVIRRQQQHDLPPPPQYHELHQHQPESISYPKSSSPVQQHGIDIDETPTKGGKIASSNTSKAYKGLRHFSMMVCKKVEEKGTTTYNEVADELVYAIMNANATMTEDNDDGTPPSNNKRKKNKNDSPRQEMECVTASTTSKKSLQGSPQQQYATPTSSKTKQQLDDEKNIRRRVYDALNVLMAVDIIIKDNKRKEIRWNGLPTMIDSISHNQQLHSSTMTTSLTGGNIMPGNSDYDSLRREYDEKLNDVNRKRQSLQELVIQQICFRNLTELNYYREILLSHKDSQQLHRRQQSSNNVSRRMADDEIQRDPSSSAENAIDETTNTPPRRHTLRSQHSSATNPPNVKSSSSVTSRKEAQRHPKDMAFDPPTPPLPPPSQQPQSIKSTSDLHRQPTDQQSTTKELEQHGDRDVPPKDNKIPLPFIIVNTNSSAVIQCNMSRDLTDIMFDFSMPFEINDDNTILKRLGLHKTTDKVLHEMLPDDLYQYCQKYSLLEEVLQRQAPSQIIAAAAAVAAANAAAGTTGTKSGHGRLMLHRDSSSSSFHYPIVTTTVTTTSSATPVVTATKRPRNHRYRM